MSAGIDIEWNKRARFQVQVSWFLAKVTRSVSTAARQRHGSCVVLANVRRVKEQYGSTGAVNDHGASGQ